MTPLALGTANPELLQNLKALIELHKGEEMSTELIREELDIEQYSKESTELNAMLAAMHHAQDLMRTKNGIYVLSAWSSEYRAAHPTKKKKATAPRPITPAPLPSKAADETPKTPQSANHMEVVGKATDGALIARDPDTGQVYTCTPL